MWSPNQEYRPESMKIVWEVAPYLRGYGADIGAGMFKVLPQAVSIDNGNHEMFNHHIDPNIKVQSADHLPMLADKCFNWVYSSHLLEHMEDPLKALKEWWRVLDVGGVMVLYLPHDELYPTIGSKLGNPDHKHDLNEQKVIDWMLRVGGWDLERCEKRDKDEEYSFLMVFKKLQGNKHHYSHKGLRPEKTACIVRYGAFGDMIQSSTVAHALKKQGYHITMFCSAPGSDVIMHDPNIDKIVLFEKDQVPNADLGSFWGWQKKNFDKFVNLSESVEASLLAMPGRTAHEWAPQARHMLMNHNYLEMTHKIAAVPHDPQVKFYATPDEKAWAKKQRLSMKEKMVVMWSLAGSSVHKTWAGLDNVMASMLIRFPDTAIMLVGGPECEMLEAGWENEPRVYRCCGKMTIRQSLAMLDHVDLLVGPETGVMNAACCMDMAKLVFLSHSTHENLTRDWKNVIPMWSKNTSCPGRGNNEVPACHQLHFGFTYCKRHEETGTAQCMADITVGQVWELVEVEMDRIINDKLKAA